MLMALHLLNTIAGKSGFAGQGGLRNLQLLSSADQLFLQELAHVRELSVRAS